MYLAALYGKTPDAAVEHPILSDRFAAEAEYLSGVRLIEAGGNRNVTSLTVRFRREDSR